jgi:hypothetical protein
MDRLNHSLVATCGLALVLAATGCRSTRSEVPPGRQYMNDGRQIPPVGFSAEPHQAPNSGFAGGAPGAVPGSSNAYPTPNFSSSSTSNYGAPTIGSYGPPATGASLPMPMPGSAASLGVPGAGTSPSSGASASTQGIPTYDMGSMPSRSSDAMPSTQSAESTSTRQPQIPVTPADGWPPPQ